VWAIGILGWVILAAVAGTLSGAVCAVVFIIERLSRSQQGENAA
jgi:hypothetical protein